MFVQRTRLGQALVALGLSLAVVGGLLLALATVLGSPSVAGEAAPALIGVESYGVPIESELARSVEVVLPPGAMSQETAAAVAARMVRDSAVVDEISRAAGTAHDLWVDGEPASLLLDPAVITPAAIAAMRDVDLGLARSIGSEVRVTPAPIVLPVTSQSADYVSGAKEAARWLLGVGLVAFVIGAILDERWDRTIRRTSTALLVFGAILAAAAIAARLLDVPSAGWSTPTVIAMVAAPTVPLLVGAAAALGLGAFCRAVAAQAAPGVAARVDARRRAKESPPPAPTGTQVTRRKGKAVRQQAIDAFFEPDVAVKEAVPDEEQADSAEVLAAIDPEQAEVQARRAATPVMGKGDDGFHRAVDAVETAPTGSSNEGDEPQTPEEAEAAAQAQREAQERVDPDRRPLRTHLPR
jgi:hypothetical protein